MKMTLSSKKEGNLSFDLSSATLHIIAMASMLIDHAMKTVIEGDSWVFVLGRLALLCIRVIDYVKSKGKKWAYILTAIVVSVAGMLLGVVFMVDYSGIGVLTVLVFYLFHERKWWCMLVQLLAMFFFNVVALGAFGPVYALSVFGNSLEIPLQGFAVLALIPIWLYHGRQGYHSKPFQYICYAFYPVHMLILYLITILLTLL
jgi:hypothetical protein